MQFFPECLVCIARQALNTLNVVYENDADKKRELLKTVFAYLSDADMTITTPHIASKVQKIIAEKTGVADPFHDIKRDNYSKALKFEKYLETYIESSDDPLRESVCTAILGNIIDLAANPNVNIEQEINRLSSNNTHLKYYPHFAEEVNNAKEILYIADNFEEIIFDRFLIKQLSTDKVTVAVRDSVFMNDLTINDVKEIELDKLCKVIPIGSGIAGVDLNSCTSEFTNIFNRASVVIAKGQGNFETLFPSERPVYFLFKVKCGSVAEIANLPLGTGALIYSNNNKGES